MLRYAASADGTRIAGEASGSGPPLVCVHGAGSARWSFDAVRPLLDGSFTILAVDRRGRGDSADGPGPYAIEREAEDVEATLRAAGDGACLFGHSYGGLVAAAVLARGEVSVPRAVLYEPPGGGVLAIEEQIDAWAGLIEAGATDTFVAEFLDRVGGYAPTEIEAMRDTPAWERRKEIAPTVPRELRAELAYRPDADGLAASRAPTLLLLGSDSPRWAIESTDVYAGALANATVHRLDGHGHGGLLSGPDRVAREVRDFLLG